MIIKRTFKDRAEWLEWRKKGIGGSDIPKMLNLSRFGDRLDLLLEKANLTESKPINEALFVAAEVAEDEARKRLARQEIVAKELKPCNVESKENPIFRASLDGYNEDGVLFEHKVLGESMFDEVCQAYENNKPHRELNAILSQISYQAWLVRPKVIIMYLTSYVEKRQQWYKIEAKRLPSHIKIKNRVLKLWTHVNLLTTSQKR